MNPASLSAPRKKTVALLLGCAFFTGAAGTATAAQDDWDAPEYAVVKKTAGTRNVFSVSDDNDFWGRWSDKYYTNHTRFSLTLGEDSPNENGLLEPCFFSFGQEMYAPKNREAKIPDEHDHPYAAYLYVSAGRAFYAENFFAAAELQLGATGDWALGKPVQRRYHALIGEVKPAGWDTQIHRRIVAQLLAENRIRVPLVGRCGNAGGWGADVIVRGSMDAGNLRGTLSAAGEARFGWNLPRDFGVAGMRRSTSVVLDPETAVSVYGFLDLQGDAIFWDKTLTGNNGGSGADIYAYPLAAQLTIGLGAVYENVMLSIFQTFRTKDFSTQDKDFFAYGGFKLSILF